MITATWTPIANTVAADLSLPGHEDRTTADIIRILDAQGFTLCKYADDLESAREGLTLDEALAIAAEDPTLIAVCR